MRYIEDILIEKAILNVVDVNGDGAIIGSQTLTVDEDSEQFIRKHIIKSLNDDFTHSATFMDNSSEVAKHVREVLDDPKMFTTASHSITEHMFNKVKHTDIPSGDLLFVQYVADGQRCYAILKLDHKVSNAHKITFKDDELCIDLVSNENVLPTMGQALKKCVFFTKAPENQIEIIVVNKKEKMEGGKQDYFTNDFLEVIVVSDDTDKTRRFKTTIEVWTQKSLSEQIDLANHLREVTNDALLTDESISIKEFTDNAFDHIKDSEDMTKSLVEGLANRGYNIGCKFEVNKIWVEKRMKLKQIKTDVGITIKGEFEAFKDSQRFVIKKNGDGTIDYIIKGVRRIVECKG